MRLSLHVEWVSACMSILIVILHVLICDCQVSIPKERGPSFTIEPPTEATFANTKGTHIQCSATGTPNPYIQWVVADGNPALPIQDLRELDTTNGVLILKPFSAEQYRLDVHAVTYRCVANNSFGTIVSNDVQVRGVVLQPYDAQVYDSFASEGNTAVFKCQIPTVLKDFVSVSAWIKNDNLLIQTTDTDAALGKYTIASTGELYINDVSLSESGSQYKCKTTHKLVNESIISKNGGRLFVTAPHGNIATKIVDLIPNIESTLGDLAVISCIAQGIPVPNIAWFRKEANGKISQISQTGRFRITKNTLEIKKVEKSDEGHYICEASSTTGRDQAEILLQVNEQLRASIQPSVQVVKAKEEITFQCKISGGSNAKFSWLRNGKVITGETGSSLYIKSVEAADQGMFQCMVEENHMKAQAAVELHLTDIAPQLLSTFDEISVQPGDTITLECSATGMPQPEISWDMDGMTIEGNSRIHLTRNVETTGIVLSNLKIRNVKSEDGGIYSCKATNQGGVGQHSSRVNVFGPIKSRKAPPKIVVSGSDAVLNCPYFGHPVLSLSWHKDGRRLPASIRQIAFKNGTLLMKNVHASSDKGKYICLVMTPEGNVVESSLDLKVIVAPKIVPFSFQEDLLREGMRARLQCVVSEGDLPLSITWMKDGNLLYNHAADHAINIRVLDDFSSILTVGSINPRHNGNYTCVASNIAAIAPKIVPFSFQDVHFEGSTARLVCGLLEGDLPVQFFWLKNDIPVDTSLSSSDTSVSIHDIEGVSSILTIKNIEAEHAGNYTCVAKNRVASAKRSSVLVVNVAPKIVPFSFQGEHLFEGALARITCVVYQGDLPLTIEWLKDGVHVAGVAGADVRQIDEYTSILTIDHVSVKHTGNYTCIAKNSAEATSHSAVLSVNVPPKIVPFTFQEDQLLEGTLARVSCIISRGDLPLSIRWEKDGEAIPANLGVSVMSFDEHSSIMTIETVAKKHSGHYTCIASNAAGTANFSAEILVKVPPHWVITPESVSVLSGQDLTLDCQAAGFPTPLINWMHTLDPSELAPVTVSINERFNVFLNGSLHIKQVDATTAGYYFCQASNGVGIGLSASAFINIHAPPTFHTKFQMASSPVGKEYSMNCVSEGDLPITTHWFKDGRRLAENPASRRYKIVTVTTTLGVSSTLNLIKASREDQGRYMCVAENSHGKNNMTFELIMKDIPDAPKDIKVSFLGTRRIEFTWQKAFDGNDPITKYIIEYINEFEDWGKAVRVEIASGEKVTGSVSNLEPDTNYVFRMFAVNSQGQSKDSIIVKGTTLKEAPSVAPQNIHVSSNNENTITVTWAKSPEEQSQSGKITGYYVGYKEDDINVPYSFKTLMTLDSESPEHSVHIMNLKKFTKYSVVVQAYNEQGKGPLSQPVIVMTSEAVPNSAPLNVRCTTLTSQSIHVTWGPPQASGINGILRRYVVMYKAASGWYEDELHTMNSTTTTATLADLEKYTNYSIRVSAATKAGEGPFSEPIYCKTLDDEPDAPADVKVLLTSESSVLVTWKHPLKPNGIVKSFVVYYRAVDNAKDITRNTLPAQYMQMEIPGLKKGKRYEFWVKASNIVGEGRASNVIAQTPSSNNVPARIIPFDEKVIMPWKSDVTLSCKAVGTPVLERKWYHKDEIIQTSSRQYITNDGALVIKELLEEDNGDYYCVVTNDLSEDRVTYTIHVLLPPLPPTVEVAHSSSSSIELKWKMSRIVGQVKGYILHVRREFGDWKEISLDADVASYKLNGLDCGTNYEIVMAAFNKIGLGDKSQPMLAPTNGSAPGPPPKEDLLEETATSVSINLNAWKIHSCPILYYIVEYKVRGTGEWVFAANNVKPEQKRLVVRDLSPATWYQLRITAHSSAGSSVGEYNFATMTITGATISPNVMLQDEADNVSSSPKVDLWVAVSVILSVLLVIVVLALACLFVKKGNCANNQKAPSCPMRQEIHRGTLSRPHTEFGTMSSAGYQDDPVPYASCGLGSFSTGTLPHSGGCPPVPPRQMDHFDTLHLQHKIMLGNSGFSPVQSNPAETAFLFPQVSSGMPCAPHTSATGYPPKA